MLLHPGLKGGLHLRPFLANYTLKVRVRHQRQFRLPGRAASGDTSEMLLRRVLGCRAAHSGRLHRLPRQRSRTGLGAVMAVGFEHEEGRREMIDHILRASRRSPFGGNWA